MLVRITDPLPRTDGVGLPTDSMEPVATVLKVVWLPCILQDLSSIQRHILARVAVHTWTHDGSIPFVPPNAHQAAVAFNLAAPQVRLLVAAGSRRPSFTLSHLGEYVARRTFRLVPWEVDQAREMAFDRMRDLMRNDWEIGAA